MNLSLAIILLVDWIVTDGIVCTGKTESRDSSSGRVIAIGNMLAWVIGISLNSRAQVR